MTTSLTQNSSLAQVISKINEIIVKHDALQELSDDMFLDFDVVKTETTKLKSRVNSNQSQYLGNVQFLQDVSNVTAFVSGASVGRRLRYVLDQLKNELIVMIEAMANTARPVDLGPVGEEINKAIAMVEANVPDGIKLDYRFQEIEKSIRTLNGSDEQKLWVPFTMQIESPTSLIAQALNRAEATFVEAEVTVLNAEKKSVKTEAGIRITATINDQGLITFSHIPSETVNVWYPILIERKNIKEKDLWNLLEVIQMTSSTTVNNDEINQFMIYVLNQLQIMKGIDWNSEKNLSEAFDLIEKSRMAPKSLQVTQLNDEQIAVQFSFEDHPLLTHFVLERWDEETKTWKPFDNEEGIVHLPS